jgi:hypothetical protein
MPPLSSAPAEPPSTTREDAKAVVKFISNYHCSLALFRKHAVAVAEEKHELVRELLKPGETRFATFFITIQRLVDVRDALEQTVADRDWKEWSEKQSYKEVAKEVKKTIQREAFWECAEQLVKLVEPTVVLLRLVDGTTPCIGKVYHSCYKVQQCLTEVLATIRWLSAAQTRQVKSLGPAAL